MSNEKKLKLFKRYIEQNGRLTMHPELKAQFDQFMKDGTGLDDMGYENLSQMSQIKMSDAGNTLRNDILNQGNQANWGQDYTQSFDSSGGDVDWGANYVNSLEGDATFGQQDYVDSFDGDFTSTYTDQTNQVGDNDESLLNTAISTPKEGDYGYNPVLHGDNAIDSEGMGQWYADKFKDWLANDQSFKMKDWKNNPELHKQFTDYMESSAMIPGMSFEDSQLLYDQKNTFLNNQNTEIANQTYEGLADGYAPGTDIEGNPVFEGPEWAMKYQDGMELKPGWTVDENNNIVKEDGTFVYPSSDDSAWMDEQNAIAWDGSSLEGIEPVTITSPVYDPDNEGLVTLSDGQGNETVTEPDGTPVGGGGGGWYPGKLLFEMMTDDKGFFQGGEKGRLFGRIRDMLGNPSAKDIDNKVNNNNVPDMKQVTKTRTNSPMITGAGGSGRINPGAPGFNMHSGLFGRMPGIKPTNDELNQ